MSTYILLTKLSPDKLVDPRKRETIGREWFEEVKTRCPEAKWIEHYALLGEYDFMDIYEAPNEETAAKVSLITMSKGAVKAESWSAIPYRKFVEIAKGL
ncbi:MAG: GYD domain-containing protein [Bacteroidota bacterium]